MAFSESWSTLLDELADLPDEATFATPLSHEQFRISDVREGQIVIHFLDHNGEETTPLPRDKFETLYQHVTDSIDGFGLDRLPPNAEPYASVLSVHPDVELDREEWSLAKTKTPSSSPLLETSTEEQRHTHQSGQPALSIDEMIENMGEPPEKVVCPIDGCEYSHRSASSVARHVSGSSTDKHIWENTSYAGWRDFVRKHDETPG